MFTNTKVATIKDDAECRAQQIGIFPAQNEVPRRQFFRKHTTKFRDTTKKAFSAMEKAFLLLFSKEIRPSLRPRLP
jgi:hypothetical protein